MYLKSHRLGGCAGGCAGGLCGRLCGAPWGVVRDGSGCFWLVAPFGQFTVFLHVSENLAAQAISHSITPPFQNNANPLNSIPFQWSWGHPSPTLSPKQCNCKYFQWFWSLLPPHSFQKPCKSMFPLLHQKRSKACKTCGFSNVLRGWEERVLPLSLWKFCTSSLNLMRILGNASDGHELPWEIRKPYEKLNQIYEIEQTCMTARTSSLKFDKQHWKLTEFCEIHYIPWQSSEIWKTPYCLTIISHCLSMIS